MLMERWRQTQLVRMLTSGQKWRGVSIDARGDSCCEAEEDKPGGASGLQSLRSVPSWGMMKVPAQIRKILPEEFAEVCSRPSKMSYEERVRSIQAGVRHRAAPLTVPNRFKHLAPSQES